MSNEIVRVEPVVPSMPVMSYYGTLDEIERVAIACAKSGYWKDVRDASHALVKMLAGREMGIAPLAAISGIHVIEGKPTAGANLIAANVKRSGRYDYRVLERSDTRCVLAWFDRGEKVGESAFSMTDAARADLATKSNWKKYPRAMLFARALTEGVRVYCPDAAGGVVYTVEELRPDLEVTAEGELVSAPAAPEVTSAGKGLGWPSEEPVRTVEEPPTPQAPEPLISDPQRKRLWAIWSKRAEQMHLGPGAKEQGLRDILASFSMSNTTEIPRRVYEAVIAACEKWLPPVADGEPDPYDAQERAEAESPF